MSIRRILVPTDFSPHSDAALAHARDLGSSVGATIRLVHVFDDPFVDTAIPGDGHTLLPPQMRALMIAGVEVRLRERLGAAVDTSLGHETALITGPVASTIVEYARSHAIDLIVMGTHGRGGIAHLLLGSVAERVVRTAPCPVMTVRRPVTAPGPNMAGVPEPVQA